jgi:membrane protease YdiL (CAAX protease family)
VSVPLVRVAVVFYGVLALAAWGWAALFDLPLLGETTPTPRALAEGAVPGLAIVVASDLLYRVSARARAASDVMARMLGPLRARDAAALALLSGFAEEIAFRGALWPQLGLAGTTIFFAICHVIPVRGLALYPLYAFVAGTLLGVLRERTGSVWPPVAAHAIVNGVNLTRLGALARRDPPPAFPLPPAPPHPSPAETPLLSPVVDTDADYPITVWRYDLRVELTGTDRETLPDCLEGEELGLFAHVPREGVARELREGLFVFAASLPEPMPHFPADVAAISAYLFEPVVGLEVAERYVDDETTDDVRAWKIVALRGEWVNVPLVVQEDEGRFVVDSDAEDLETIRARWKGYPRWFQDGMRFRYPRLRDL